MPVQLVTTTRNAFLNYMLVSLVGARREVGGEPDLVPWARRLRGEHGVVRMLDLIALSERDVFALVPLTDEDQERVRALMQRLGLAFRPAAMVGDLQPQSRQIRASKAICTGPAIHLVS